MTLAHALHVEEPEGQPRCAWALDREIVLSRVYDAPRDLLFRAWTEVDRLASWFGPRGFTTTIHARTSRPRSLLAGDHGGGGGSVVCFDGDAEEWVHPGRQRITGDGSAWNVPPSFGGTRLDTLELDIEAGNSDQDTWSSLVFSSREMGQDLAVGEYVNAERYPFEEPGSPGLSVTVDGRGCNAVRGDFHITSVEATGDEITSLTATFEQHCDNIPAVLRGCVHVER